MKGTLIPLKEYYEKYRYDGESMYKFVSRKIEEEVFLLKDRAMHYHFAKGTGYVFIAGKNHKFLMEGIVR